jgi:hypothetical protein
MITLSVDGIIARIETLKEAGVVNDVGGLGNIQAAPENTIVTDSVFVLPPTKAGGPNITGTTRVNQKVTTLVGVAIVFLNIGAGAEMTSHIQTTCDAVEDLLLGWVPGSGLSPFTLASARPEEINTAKGYLIYSFIFETSYHARKP